MKRQQTLLICIVLSILIHMLFYSFGDGLWDQMVQNTSTHRSKRTMKVIRTPQKQKPDEIKKPKEDAGQIVELPTPKEEEIPLKSDYLSEHNHRTDKETASNQYSINPEVIAPEYSDSHKVQYEDVIDVNAEEASTGATTGNQQYKPNNNGKLFSNPSPFSRTNKDGLKKPTLASTTISNLSGAPSNDLLNEEKSNRTELNAHAYKYASYMNQIRRMVNFFWQQQLDNLNEPLRQESYTTVVSVEIDENGNLNTIVVRHQSGSEPVDLCVTKAFKTAGPFPPPPILLVENGIVTLPDFGFTLNVSGGQMNYGGIDPRAGVRFPGILKSTY